MIRTEYWRNKMVDWEFRGASFTPPSTLYFAQFAITAGQSPRSTAITTGKTTIPLTPNNRMYRCTTAGTTSGSEPTWPTTAGATVTDGSVVWTEMTPDFHNNVSANLPELVGNGYARAGLACSMANYAATNGATLVTNPSSGAGGTTSNNVAIAFPTPTGAQGIVAFMGWFDASTSGNLISYFPLSTLANITGASTPFSIPISQGQIQIDNS